MLHGSSILHYSLSVRILLIGILVHLISRLNVNEELCIGFVLLNITDVMLLNLVTHFYLQFVVLFWFWEI
jgi:hypothetical protein